jgi:hypothetical protein|tara:strand:+ start:354 stop:581 length:228 start_codon:yes stop_codon:yes gene_type:complete
MPRTPLFGNPLAQQLFSSMMDKKLLTRDSFQYILSLDDDELIKAIRVIEPLSVVDEKANGGIVSLNQMIRPIGYM